MSFVITHNDRVILGPYAEWSPHYMTAIIQARTRINTVKLTLADVNNLPLSFEGGIVIRQAVEVIPDHDSRVERLDGPFWTFTEDLGTATYTVLPRDLALIRSEMKKKAEEYRYNKEVAGVKITIQGQEVTVYTDRETRNVFVQALMLMGDTDNRRWKFPSENIWLYLSKADLATVVGAGAQYIQQQFDWEEDIGIRIDAAETIEDLLGIYPELSPAPETPTPEEPQV